MTVRPNSMPKASGSTYKSRGSNPRVPDLMTRQAGSHLEESSWMGCRMHVGGPGSMFEGHILYQEGNYSCLDV